MYALYVAMFCNIHDTQELYKMITDPYPFSYVVGLASLCKDVILSILQILSNSVSSIDVLYKIVYGALLRNLIQHIFSQFTFPPLVFFLTHFQIAFCRFFVERKVSRFISSKTSLLFCLHYFMIS